MLGERLSEMRAVGGDGSLDSYARSVVEHSADGIEDDIRWIDRMIDAERAQLTVVAAVKAVDQGGLHRGAEGEGERP